MAASIGVAAAYVSAGAVQQTLARSRAAAFSDAAAQGFSEAALRSRTAELSPGAIAVAERHDPAASSNDDPRLNALAARLQRGALRGAAPLMLVSNNPAAKPYRVVGALAGARDMECLTEAVYYEARGETPAGQAAVAQVVLNRVRHPAFPKSVCAVVFQRAGQSCQFSFACDGSMHRTRESGAWRRAQGVASRALDGFVMTEVGNATHFHAARIGPQWASMVRVSQVGLHVFYRFGGRRGAPGVFRQPAPEAQSHAVYASILPMAAPKAEPSAAVTPAQAAAEASRTLEAPVSAETKPATSKSADMKTEQSAAATSADS